MLKKIAMGALLTGLVAVLILGAVNRTNAVSGEGAGETGRRGQTTETVAVNANTQNYAEREGAANEGTGRGGRWAQSRTADQALVEQDAGALSGVPQADVQPAEWRTVEGTVVSVADDLVEVETTAGETIPFEGQPLRYALSQGFALKIGDAVALSGFDENGEFKLGKVTSLNSGVSISLRDASGRPGWSGGGRRG